MSDFTFRDGQLLVNLIGSERMTAGKCYEVVSSYHGASGCGPQEWTRVADDRGYVTGFDPDRFIPQMPGRVPNKSALLVGLRMLHSAKEMLGDVGSTGPLKGLHDALVRMRNDAEAIVALSADHAASGQITFNKAEGDVHAVVFDVAINGHVFAQLIGYSQRPYTFAVLGEEAQIIDVPDFEQARERVGEIVLALARRQDTDPSFMALTLAVEAKIDREARANA